MKSVLEDVKRLIAETCAIDAAIVKPEGRLIEYGIDSVRAMDLLISLEETFHLEIPNNDAARLGTVAEVVAYVTRKTAR